jgi:hypothetical protein
MSILKPSKHTNLHYSVVNISANILKILKENGIIKYAELLDILKEKIGNDVSEVFLSSLTFLYIMKKIEYIEKLDSLRINNEIM